ncbi:MAG: methylated-DNA--[protein]-cysteine S-methyltransferase [Syntrophales bacterium]|nr:methylated-DNA--[protein]-cysteine S-methyltransferase [Syntrophales bacterium]MDD5640804.1 methylated-DNA--[protein]-cysteine S-methyltransferase [Syntrophales bacterium]
MRNKASLHNSWGFTYCLPDTPLGDLTLSFSARGLAVLTYGKPETGLTSASPPPAMAAWLEAVKKELAAYFSGTPTTFASLPLDPKGTPFQLRVWQELRKIPWGAAISYKELAARAGSPRGFRAVGQANGANPIPIIIPCHRVINADGSLGGYSSGLERKRWLLRHEGLSF